MEDLIGELEFEDFQFEGTMDDELAELNSQLDD